MTPEEVRQFIHHNRMGVLSLAKDGQAYGIPLFYGHDGKSFYFHTRPGAKEAYAARTGEACLTIIRVVSLDQWASVQAFGPIERVDQTLEAMNALMVVPLPPDWGETPRGEPRRSAGLQLAYRLSPVRLSGRYSHAASESAEARAIAFGGM